MKANSTWVKGYQSIIDNDRCHSVVVGLPEAKGGHNLGATALEVCLMSLAGCVTTIFAMIATKMRIDYDKMSANLEAEQPEGSPTLTKVVVNFEIKDPSDEAKARKCFEMTLKQCPVGVLFVNAGVELIENFKAV